MKPRQELPEGFKAAIIGMKVGDARKAHNYLFNGITRETVEDLMFALKERITGVDHRKIAVSVEPDYDNPNESSAVRRLS